jgi:nucleoside-diphosphate-sugar epimerase
MSIMLTGGAGFVGLNVAQRLLERGDTVVTYGLEAPPEKAMRCFEQLPGRLHVVRGDVRDREALRRAMSEHGVSRLVHGAAVTASLQRESTQADLIAAVNLGGTIEVLEAAVAHGISRLVQLGTGSVFGAQVHAIDQLVEERDIPVPDSIYGITKYAAERIGLRYRSTRGLDLVVGRLGVVFGRWEYDTGVRDTLSLPLALTAMARAGGTARFCRDLPNDWVYATDVADAVVRLIDAPALPRPVYHIGSGQPWSPVSWCKRLQQTYPAFNYELVDQREQANVGVAAPSARPPFSIAHLKNDLAYEPRYGEAEALQDYLSHLDAA